MEENKTAENSKEKKKENILVRGKKWMQNKLDSVAKFASDNPQMIFPIVTAFGSLAFTGLRMITGAGTNQIDHCRVEDDVTGEEFITKHPLTNDEILELGNRMIDGEWKGSALNDMGLLKNEKHRK